MDPLKLHKILLGVGVAVIVALVVALGLITKKSATLLRRRDNLRKDLSALRQKYEADTKALRATHTAQIDRSEAIVASGVASRAEIVKATAFTINDLVNRQQFVQFGNLQDPEDRSADHGKRQLNTIGHAMLAGHQQNSNTT